MLKINFETKILEKNVGKKYLKHNKTKKIATNIRKCDTIFVLLAPPTEIRRKTRSNSFLL